MFKAVFINIFFEKKKILIAFIIIFSLLLLYVGIQTMLLVKQVKDTALPDLTIEGRVGEDGTFYYKMYNDMTGLSNEIQQIVGSQMRVYGVTCRNLLIVTTGKALYKIYYMVYGVEEQFLTKELKGCLKEGRLPKPGAKEAVVGNFAARYYKLKIGDKIDLPITLNKETKETENKQYIVTGILSDNVDYYRGAIFISKDTFEASNGKQNENLLLIYFKDSSSIKTYDKLIVKLNDLRDKYGVGGMQVFYENKYNMKRNLVMNGLTTLFLSSLIMFLLISYMMKGITKKIGLLKALGVSDFYIIKTFIGGLGICMLLSIITSMIGVYATKEALNQSLSAFYEYSVKYFAVDLYVFLSTIGFSGLMFMIVYILVVFRSARISPRDAMLTM